MGKTASLASLGSIADTSLGFRNRIINGDMRIDQRNAGASVTPTSGQYLVDRFYAGLTQSSKFTVQQNAASITPPAGFTNYLGITSSSAYTVLSGDAFFIAQAIEGFNIADFGWGAAGAQSVTLSFWVRSSLTGTFGGAVKNQASNRAYPFTYAISSANTWEQKTITIAGDTSGTWLTTTSAGLRLIFSLGMGSTFSSTAGAWTAGDFFSATGATSIMGTSGATFYITGVQLEAGTAASPFEYRPYGTELALCQRYFQSLTDPPLRGVVATTSGANRVACSLLVPMRSTPTNNLVQAGGTGQARFYDGTVSNGAISAIAGFYATPRSIEYDMTMSVSTYTVGRATCLYLDSPSFSYSSTFQLSSEL
jgi:hypothetical protein